MDSQSNLPRRHWPTLGLAALVHVRRRAHTTTAHMRERGQIVANHVDRRVPLDVLARRGQLLWVRHEMDQDEEAFHGAVGNETEKGTERDRHETESDGDTPLAPADLSDLEGGTADEDDQDLNSELCDKK